MVDAELAAPRPAGGVGVVDIEARNAWRNDADIEARAFAVEILFTLGDRRFTKAIGQDGAVALALAGRLAGWFNGGIM
jgi:hypothetical protein